jgi:MFS family permease
MQKSEYRVYGYRWAVLAAFMAIVVANQMLWITFAAITGDAANFYKTSDLNIGLLSLVFMVVYILVSIPASWAIDTYGVKVATGFGAVMTGLFGILRGVWADNYTLVLVAQIGIAIGQPFILNAITTVGAHWFPERERATAAGLGSLAIYLGIFLGLVLTPFLVSRQGIAATLIIDGIIALAGMLIFILVARERPATPPCPPGLEVRSLVTAGYKQIFKVRDFILLLVIFFVGLGVFNAVTTWIEDILSPRGFTSAQAGITGGLMIAGGILGALVIPTLSDHQRKRVPFITIALIGATIGLLGIALAPSFWLVLAGALLLGFFLLSTGPIGFQYGAETTYPIPEGTSNGLLLMVGQVSGIIFIVLMDALKSPQSGSMTVSLVLLMVLMVVSLIISRFLKEPRVFLTEAEDLSTEPSPDSAASELKG